MIQTGPIRPPIRIETPQPARIPRRKVLILNPQSESNITSLKNALRFIEKGIAVWGDGGLLFTNRGTENANRHRRDSSRIPEVSLCASARFSRWERKQEHDRRNAIGSHTKDEWMAVLKKYGNRCLRCEVDGEEVPLTKDHVVPFSEGGTDYVSNLQPLCLKCNTWKGKRDIDFRPSYAASHNIGD